MLLFRIRLSEPRGGLDLQPDVQRQQDPDEGGEGAEQEVRLVDTILEVS